MTAETGHSDTSAQLRRELGVFGATMLGLGSILGTGVFVIIGVAAGIAGPAVVVAILLAAMVATCNALSSAQLAASHSVSGGTYEYGYRYLSPSFGFTAGWMFLLAKSASAATAALGFAGYLLHAIGGGTGWLVPMAVAVTIGLTLIVLSGIRRSSLTNVVIVSVTLLALIAFVTAGLPSLMKAGRTNFSAFFGGHGQAGSPIAALLHASALMFVAYTGYGRIATLGEEVREPRRTIPRAIVGTLLVSAILYASVSIVAIGTVGSARLEEATLSRAAPLEIVARGFDIPGIAWLVAVGAMTAMLGVLLNLILGLSRVLLAMGRRGDVPSIFARLDAKQTTPYAAVLLVGVVITGLTLIGNVETTWSFSAFTVLVYYAITNLAALRLPCEQRFYPAPIAWCGLFTCLFLAFWIDRQILAAGLGLIVCGLIWHTVARRIRR